MPTKILIVEDEPIIAADLSDRLTDMGYQIMDTVASGEAAIERVAIEMPDLLLLDVQLEGQLDGIETAEKILAIQAIPLIFLTSNTDSATFKRAKFTRPFAFISKPYRGRDLQHSIELALENYKKSASTQQEHVLKPIAENALSDRVFIKTDKGMERLYWATVLWVEADGYYAKVVTAQQSYHLSMTLKKFIEQTVLPANFLRIHRSYLINLQHLEQFGEIYLTIQGHQLPIGRSYKSELKKRLQIL